MDDWEEGQERGRELELEDVLNFVDAELTVTSPFSSAYSALSTLRKSLKEEKHHV